MIELGLSYAESIIGELPDDVEKKLKTAFKEYITEKITFHTACNKVADLIGKEDPVVRLRDILDLPEEPLPSPDDETDEDPATTRKKTRTWSVAEDQRLLAGIFHYGLENWQAVAQFLGSGRNRAQCSQRWTRGLNPRISKKSWTPEEDKTLESLVRIHGAKSWTKIASIMGNRSDVQCRYHYKQILQGSNSGQQSEDDTHPLSISRNGPLAMSSDNFFQRPVQPPLRTQMLESIQEEDEQPMSLASARFTGSLPIFNIVQQPAQPAYAPAPFIQTIPIQPRRNYGYAMNPIPQMPPMPPSIPAYPQHAQDTSNIQMAPLRWGSQPDAGDKDLDTFLSHFK